MAAVAPSPSLHAMYRQLYDFFGDSLATRFGTGTPPATAATPVPPEGTRKDPPAFGGDPGATGGGGSARKMPQLTANATVSPRDEDPPAPAARPPPPPLPRPPLPATAATTAPGLARCRGPPRQPLGHRPGAHDLFPKCRFAPRGTPRFSFVIAGRQTGRRCQGRRFQSLFATHPPVPPAPQQQPPTLAAAAAPHHPPGTGHGGRYAQKLPVIGRGGRSGRRWPRSEYSLLLPL